MSACGREFHIACMRSKISSFEAARRGSRARRRPTKSHTGSIGDISADVDEADISTPVAVDQRAANCLEETVRSFTAMRSRYQSPRADVTFRRPLPVFRVIRCSSIHCFQTRIIVELFRCTRAPIARSENPPSQRPLILSRSNSISYWNFSLFRSGLTKP
ncbi:uncharacterized protein TNCV_3989651 [Trichonephila clavipes]|uniref:Uncharacterized protein n=1 Tax=Trichonephila clavipes TaxID=2585209 RepID=A0A8X6SX25_TRICX|nr:uncharacterized protein TNCV_3989651 [Trichonephila clavipes]